MLQPLSHYFLKFVLPRTGGAAIAFPLLCPTDTPQARAGGAAIAVCEALQLCEVHVLFDACVVGRVELLVASWAGAGGEVLHGGAHRVGPALREPHAGVRTLPKTTFLKSFNF